MTVRELIHESGIDIQTEYVIKRYDEQAIEDMKNLKESVNKTLDTVELSELGLKHNARVYSVNQLITISLMLDNICNALNDVESE